MLIFELHVKQLVSLGFYFEPRGPYVSLEGTLDFEKREKTSARFLLCSSVFQGERGRESRSRHHFWGCLKGP